MVDAFNHGTRTLLDRMDESLEFLNRMTANLEWQTLRNASAVSSDMYVSVFQRRLKWKSRWCAELISQDDGAFIDSSLLRFLCHESKTTDKMTRYIQRISSS